MTKRLTFWEQDVLLIASSRLLEIWRSQGVDPILLESIDKLIEKLDKANGVSLTMEDET